MAFKKLTVVAAKVSGSHTNMPLYINPSQLTGWGSITLAEAQSSRWYTDESKTVEVAREIVSADEIHVKVPSLTTTTELFVDYDGVRADYAAGDTYGRNAVWGDYDLVTHNEDTSTTTVADSTGNGYNGTKGAANQPIETAGKFGKAQSFTNTAWRIDHGNGVGNGNELTVSGIVYAPSWTGFQLLSKGASSQFQWRMRPLASTTSFAIDQWRSDGNTYRNVTSTSGSFKANEWMHFHVVLREGANSSIIYLNGIDEGSSTSTSGTWHTSGTGPLRQGQRGDGSSGQSNSILDEVRIRTGTLSANWITTEYNNQSDVATFFGTVTDAGGAPTANNGFILWWA